MFGKRCRTRTKARINKIAISVVGMTAAATAPSDEGDCQKIKSAYLYRYQNVMLGVRTEFPLPVSLLLAPKTACRSMTLRIKGCNGDVPSIRESSLAKAREKIEENRIRA